MNFQLNCLGTVQLYFKSVDNFYFSRGLGFFPLPSPTWGIFTYLLWVMKGVWGLLLLWGSVLVCFSYP